MPARLLFLGHSHINCLIEALRADNEDSEDSLEWRALQLKQWQGRLRRRNLSLTPEQTQDLAAAEIARIIGKLGGRSGRLKPERVPGFVKNRGIAVVVCLRGAQHIIKGLVRSKEPYDFFLPEDPSLPVERGTTIVPYRAIYARYERILDSTTKQLEHLHRLIRHNLYHVEIPPPYGDNGYIARQIGSYFATAYPDGFEIASPTLRYKLWRVSCEIYRRKCAELGITYLPVPSTTLVDGRYLHPDGYYRDAVHGNQWYGRHVIKNVVSKIGFEATNP